MYTNSVNWYETVPELEGKVMPVQVTKVQLEVLKVFIDVEPPEGGF